MKGQSGEGYSLTVLSSIFVVLRLYHENLRAEFAQPFATLPLTATDRVRRGVFGGDGRNTDRSRRRLHFPRE